MPRLFIVITGDENTDAYTQVMKELDPVIGNSNAKYLYTMGYLNDELCYIVDMDTSDDKYIIGDKFDSDDEETVTKFLRAEFHLQMKRLFRMKKMEI